MASVNVRKQLSDEVNLRPDVGGISDATQRPTLAQLRRASLECPPATTEQPRAEVSSLAARVDCIQLSPLFRGLSVPECAEIAKRAREARFDRRQTIFREGDPVRSVTVLASGRVKVTQLSRSGAEVILRVKGIGEVLGGLGAQPSVPHFLTAQTLEPCTVLVWEARKFELLEDQFPALRRNTVRIFAERLRILEERFLEMATEQVAPRLARMLVRLLEQTPYSEQFAVRIDLSREELAQMTGTTLFTVSRLLCDWEQRGMIQTQRKAVVVRNRASLIELAERARETLE